MAIYSDEVKALKLKMLVKTTAIKLKDLNTEKLNWFKCVIEISKGNDNVLADTKRKLWYFNGGIASPQTPFFADNSEDKVKISPEKRLTVPADLDSEYKHLMDSSCYKNPRLRLTIDIVRDELEILLDIQYESIRGSFRIIRKKRRAEANQARYLLGWYLLDGQEGVLQDELDAIKYLRQVSDDLPVGTYTAAAQYLYARTCLNGLEYLEKAVKARDKNALFWYADILLNGEHDVPIDIKDAERYFRETNRPDAESALEKLKAKIESG
ncbi:2256_t:CDS:2 [Ambispora leptoticha]|uniref:2256_t:CDS:1 n=1 Tax=Ambispora leptoticha TaxID=144679 RepID=A0A9N9G6I7_9GLOM|nr:2256_t:CDS:2 [Ambispora leptoticha]